MMNLFKAGVFKILMLGMLGLPITVLAKDSCSGVFSYVEAAKTFVQRTYFKTVYSEEAFFKAIEKGNINEVKRFLSRGANPSAKNSDKTLALIVALRNDQPEVAKELIKAGVDPNSRDIDTTALHTAFKYRYPEVFKMLLDAEADPNRNSAPGMEVLDPILITVIQNQRVVNAGNKEIDKFNPQQIAEMVQWLLDKKAEPNGKVRFTTVFGRKIPLVEALERGYIEVAKALIKAGADIHRTDSRGQSAWIVATRKGDEQAIRLLSDAGVTDVDGIKNRRGVYTRETFALNGSVEIVDTRVTALIQAAKHGQLEGVRVGLSQGANVHIRDSEGKTALRWAVEQGHIEIVKMLLDKEADPNTQDLDDQTPLLVAVQLGHLKIVEMLLDAKADPHKKDVYGQSPWMVANENGNAQIIRLLEDAGADK